MSDPTDIVLKRGLIGFVYRWLRNAGVVATVTGIGFIVANIYMDATYGHADAKVQRIEIACMLQGESFIYSAVAFEAECSETDQVRATYKIALAVKEVRLGRIIYQSEIGATYKVRIALAKLKVPDAQQGDTIAILYDASDPRNIRPVPTLSTYLHHARIFFMGVLALMAVLFMRWAANWRGDVEAEVAELARNADLWRCVDCAACGLVCDDDARREHDQQLGLHGVVLLEPGAEVSWRREEGRGAHAGLNSRARGVSATRSVGGGPRARACGGGRCTRWSTHDNELPLLFRGEGRGEE